MTTGAGFVNGVVQGNIAAPAALGADGAFSLPHVLPDTYRIAVSGAGIDKTGWWLASAMVGGRDALDFGLPVEAGRDAGEVVLTFSDRHAVITGTLQTTAGAPASDVFVVAYASDRAYWGPTSRRVKAVRPDVDGRYAISNPEVQPDWPVLGVSWFDAEAYHQDYLVNYPDGYTCHFIRPAWKLK